MRARAAPRQYALAALLSLGFTVLDQGAFPSNRLRFMISKDARQDMVIAMDEMLQRHSHEIRFNRMDHYPPHGLISAMVMTRSDQNILRNHYHDHMIEQLQKLRAWRLASPVEGTQKYPAAYIPELSLPQGYTQDECDRITPFEYFRALMTSALNTSGKFTAFGKQVKDDMGFPPEMVDVMYVIDKHTYKRQLEASGALPQHIAEGMDFGPEQVKPYSRFSTRFLRPDDETGHNR